MVSEQSPKKLLEIRNRLYELLTHAIPTDLIFKGLLQECIKNCDLQLKIEIATVAAEYEHKMHRGSKAIFHLEAFLGVTSAILLTTVKRRNQGDSDPSGSFSTISP